MRQFFFFFVLFLGLFLCPSMSWHSKAKIARMRGYSFSTLGEILATQSMIRSDRFGVESLQRVSLCRASAISCASHSLMLKNPAP